MPKTVRCWWKKLKMTQTDGKICRILPMTTQGTYRFNTIPTKLPMTFFTELEQIALKFAWKYKKSQIVKAILRKKNWTAGIGLLDVRLYHKSNSMVLVHKQNYRSMKQSPGINAHNYGQSMSKEARIYGERIMEKRVFSVGNAGKTG